MIEVLGRLKVFYAHLSSILKRFGHMSIRMYTRLYIYVQPSSLSFVVLIISKVFNVSSKVISSIILLFDKYKVNFLNEETFHFPLYIHIYSIYSIDIIFQ